VGSRDAVDILEKSTRDNYDGTRINRTGAKQKNWHKRNLKFSGDHHERIFWNLTPCSLVDAH
jgi:hypothetical protein